MKSGSAVPPGVTDRLAEKTIELNFARQVGSQFPTGFWFGLTQAQEAANGYDAAVQLNGLMLLFQYKVSQTKRTGGIRQLRAPHSQMIELAGRVRTGRRVFYVLPDAGTVAEIAAYGWDLLRCTWLLDVADIPTPLPEATTRAGTIRRSGLHYIDLEPAAVPARVTIRSEPTHVLLVSPDVVFGEAVPGTLAAAPTAEPDPILNDFWRIRSLMSRNAFALVLPRQT